ncbi:hypothetical protein Tco_1217106 [Tanacetum coccineum]
MGDEVRSWGGELVTIVRAHVERRIVYWIDREESVYNHDMVRNVHEGSDLDHRHWILELVLVTESVVMIHSRLLSRSDCIEVSKISTELTRTDRDWLVESSLLNVLIDKTHGYSGVGDGWLDVIVSINLLLDVLELDLVVYSTSWWRDVEEVEEMRTHIQGVERDGEVVFWVVVKGEYDDDLVIFIMSIVDSHLLDVCESRQEKWGMERQDSIGEFRLRVSEKQKPQTFSSASTPVEAENWIAHIEKIFEVLGCGDQFKASIFPYFEKKCEREYKSIRQLHEETSIDFMKRFLRLAGFLGAKAGTQEEQAKHFKWGLNDFVLIDKILNTEFTDVAQVANATRKLKSFVIAKNEGDNKRTEHGPTYTDHQKHHHRGLIRELMIEGIVTDMAIMADMATRTNMALTDGVVIDKEVKDIVMVVTDREM